MNPKRIVFNEKERFAAWTLKQFGYLRQWPREYEAIGLESDGPETDGWSGRGRILAAAVYTDYSDLAIQIHLAAAPTALWCSPVFMSVILRYPFLTCGVERVTALTAVSNERCQRLLEHVGFTREGTLRCAYPTREDAHIYGMLRKEAERWVA